jgi:alkaline phosphatase D
MLKFILTIVGFLCFVPQIHAQPSLGQGIMSGEVTQTSALLQSRLTKGSQLVNGDLLGQTGWAQFEISQSEDFNAPFTTGWQEAFARDDHIIKAQVDLLEPDTQYYYRLVYGSTTQNVKRSHTGTFHTLPKDQVIKPMRFVVVASMNYHKFLHTDQSEDKTQGYPAFAAITQLKPDFFISTGNNVYYDYPSKPITQTVKQMRQKWHELFAQPHFDQLAQHIPAYWQKNDRDYRFGDADPTGTRFPSHENGIAIFKEQVPITTPFRKDAVTYRTHRLGKLVQIWLTENRDYRSANDMPDEPNKTLWGNKQKEWLKRTLLESDATFKFLISPTPIVGPDDVRRKDNHANLKGFRHEGDAFVTWLYRNAFYDKNFYIICGDRNWQYHNVHPTGFEEFGCGTLIDANAINGIHPGNHMSTDPNRLINQKYTYDKPTGGFIMVDIKAHKNGSATASLIFYDEQGIELYRAEKTAQVTSNQD